MTLAAIVFFISMGVPLPLAWDCRINAPQVCVPAGVVRSWPDSPVQTVIVFPPCQPGVCA